MPDDFWLPGRAERDALSAPAIFPSLAEEAIDCGGRTDGHFWDGPPTDGALCACGAYVCTMLASADAAGFMPFRLGPVNA